MGLWYEFNYYGNEDRALDVIIEYYYKDKSYKDNSQYLHLWHPKNININNNILYKYNSLFLKKKFGCFVSKNRKHMHDKCKHNNKWFIIYKNQKRRFK